MSRECPKKDKRQHRARGLERPKSAFGNRRDEANFNDELDLDSDKGYSACEIVYRAHAAVSQK